MDGLSIGLLRVPQGHKHIISLSISFILRCKSTKVGKRQSYPRRYTQVNLVHTVPIRWISLVVRAAVHLRQLKVSNGSPPTRLQSFSAKLFYPIAYYLAKVKLDDNIFDGR